MVVVTPTARATPKYAKVDCDVEAKLSRLLRIDSSVAHSQCVYGATPKSDGLISLLEWFPFPFTSQPTVSPAPHPEDLWNEIFGCICTLLGSYVVSQNQIKSLLNDLYLKNKSPISISDETLRFLLRRSTHCADVQIIESSRIGKRVQRQGKAIKIIETGYSYLLYLLLFLFYGAMINGIAKESPNYLLIHRTMLSKSLANIILTLKERRKHGDLVMDQGYALLPISSLLSIVLEPSFPGLAHLTPELQQVALDVAVVELKRAHRAVEVKQDLLVIPLLAQEELSSLDAGTIPPSVAAAARYSAQQKQRSQRAMSRKIR